MEKIPKPSEFASLSPKQQQDIFDSAKQLANFCEVETRYTKSFFDEEELIWVEPIEPIVKKWGTISRPITICSLPKAWQMYVPFIQRAHPIGQTMRFHQKSSSLENYKILYSWVSGGCAKCHSDEENIKWSEGDKHIGYFCSGCHDETPFIRQWRSYE